MSVSLGNLFTAGVNHFIMNKPPSFKPDVVGEYRLELTARDESSQSSGTVNVKVTKEKPKPAKQEASVEKKPPSAKAGRLVAVPSGKPVRMYGTASKGDLRGKFTYHWTFTKIPESSQLGDADLENPTTRNPIFTPDAEGDYELKFTVTVGDATGVTDTVKVTVNDGNLPPIVNAGEDRDAVLDEVVKLNGSKTFDPNRDDLKYQWRFASKPENSKLTDEDLAGSEFSGQTSKLKGANYYYFFAGMMLLAAIIFIPVSRCYKPRAYLQEED